MSERDREKKLEGEKEREEKRHNARKESEIMVVQKNLIELVTNKEKYKVKNWQ